MNQPTFGGELRRLREQCGLSLKKFGKLVNYDPGYLSKIENGVKPPTTMLAGACDAALDTAGQLAQLVSECTETRKRHRKCPPQPTSAPIPGGMLPVVVDGRLGFVPFNSGALGIIGLDGALSNELQQHGVPALNDARRSTDGVVVGDELVTSASWDDTQCYAERLYVFGNRVAGWPGGGVVVS